MIAPARSFNPKFWPPILNKKSSLCIGGLFLSSPTPTLPRTFGVFFLSPDPALFGTQIILCDFQFCDWQSLLQYRAILHRLHLNLASSAEQNVQQIDIIPGKVMMMVVL
jgi:hypothetical protein